MLQHRTCVEVAIRDDRGRFTGKYQIETDGPGIFPESGIPTRPFIVSWLALCPIILYIAYHLSN